MQNYFSVFYFKSGISHLAWAACLCLIFSFNATAQEHEILESFNITQNGNSVLINFSIKGGASCDGVTLQRRLAKDTTYAVAAEIQGVCGGSEFTEHYVMEDDAPELGETNIYRLMLGRAGFSNETEISVIQLLTEYTIYPQPAASEVFLKYDNPGNEPVSVTVYDTAGKVVRRLLGLTSDVIFINSSDLNSGLYIFQLEYSSGALLTGKFIRSES
ncbi:MAG: T9SS type A sorting domain-containing protein [Flavobacteriales bacterium]